MFPPNALEPSTWWCVGVQRASKGSKGVQKGTKGGGVAVGFARTPETLAEEIPAWE